MIELPEGAPWRKSACARADPSGNGRRRRHDLRLHQGGRDLLRGRRRLHQAGRTDDAAAPGGRLLPGRGQVDGRRDRPPAGLRAALRRRPAPHQRPHQGPNRGAAQGGRQAQGLRGLRAAPAAPRRLPEEARRPQAAPARRPRAPAARAPRRQEAPGGLDAERPERRRGGAPGAGRGRGAGGRGAPAGQEAQLRPGQPEPGARIPPDARRSRPAAALPLNLRSPTPGRALPPPPPLLQGLASLPPGRPWQLVPPVVREPNKGCCTLAWLCWVRLWGGRGAALPDLATRPPLTAAAQGTLAASSSGASVEVLLELGWQSRWAGVAPRRVLPPPSSWGSVAASARLPVEGVLAARVSTTKWVVDS